MARSAFHAACCFVSVLASGSAAFGGPLCAGIVITDVVEGTSGELTTTGERCYERGPGVPFYYDAPNQPLPIEPEIRRPEMAASVTYFESSTLEALGVVNLGDLTNPFPPGQGRSDFRPE